MADWHARNAQHLNLPPLYALDDVIGSFAAVGFEAAVSRLKMGFVPASDHAPSFPAGLEYFYEHKSDAPADKAGFVNGANRGCPGWR